MKTASIFSSHMILQREKEICIWGTGEENELIKVTLQSAENCPGNQLVNPVYAQTIVHNGNWQVTLPPMNACRKIILMIQGEKEKIVFDDISIGDVFLAGGQSNMEFHMRYDAYASAEKEVCENPDIRFYDCPEICYPEQSQDFDYSRMGFWRTCDADNLEYFTAVGYYFAKEIQKSQGIPIGIIGCNWGGTVAATWMDEAHLAKHGQVWLDEYYEGLQSIPEDYVKNFRANPMNNRGNPFADLFGETMLFGLPREEQLKFMEQAPPPEEFFAQIGPCHQNRPSGLYEFMLKTIAPFPVKGVIWYQGESDEKHPDIYKDVLSDMIDCWRELWDEKFPFFCVQLAPFEVWLGNTGHAYPILRQQQKQLADEKEGVYLVSSSDAGMRYDIHPKKKQPIGYRLALSALHYLYGEDIPCEAPIADQVDWKGNELILHFANAYEGMVIKGNGINSLQLFEVNENVECVEISSNAYCCKTNKDKLIIHFSESVKTSQVEIAFAQTPYYEVNLYNSAEIPAMPFLCTAKKKEEI